MKDISITTLRLSHSLIEIGDEYLFMGLREPRNKLDEPLTIAQPYWLVVAGCKVTGDIIIQAKQQSPTTGRWNVISEHTVPYDQALRLIEDRIWIAKGDV